MTDFLLPYPADPEGGTLAEDTAILRYDDVIQDGRLRLESAWRSTGRALYGNAELARVLRALPAGVGNVLARVCLQATDAVLAPREPVRTDVKARFEHVLGKDGAVARLLFSTWLTVTAHAKDGAPILAARAFGQRVFTRVHAPPGEHLVRRLDAFGETGVPPHRGTWESPAGLAELPRGGAWLEPAASLDGNRVLFGLSHTDLNQHVNFLMYLRVVEQAAVARCFDLGRGASLASRETEIAYRKPSFAGDVVRVAVRAFGVGETLGVVAAVVEEDGGPSERASLAEFGAPRVLSRMVLRP